MTQEWSVIPRIKEYIGQLYFDKFLGDKFKKHLDNNEFDDSINMLIESKVLFDQSVERIIVNHIETYKYAC